MSIELIGQLAQYHAEVARGIVHTPEWDAEMRAVQAEFDADRYGAPGLIDARRVEA